jgi:hypothetical protein
VDTEDDVDGLHIEVEHVVRISFIRDIDLSPSSKVI